MSEMIPDDAAFEAIREQSIEEMAALLQDEFAAVERASTRLRESSEMAKKMDDDDLLQVLAQLRLGRAMDDFTTIYLDIKDQEAAAAADLLGELEGDSAVMGGVNAGDFDDDEFEDDDFDDEFDDLDEFDDEDEDDDLEDGAAFGP